MLKNVCNILLFSFLRVSYSGRVPHIVEYCPAGVCVVGFGPVGCCPAFVQFLVPVHAGLYSVAIIQLCRSPPRLIA